MELKRLAREARDKYMASPTQNKTVERTILELSAIGSKNVRDYLSNARALILRSRGHSSDQLKKRRKNMSRQRLISVIRKHIQPILSKADTIRSRLGFARLVREYTKDLMPCLSVENTKLTLTNARGTAVVTFDKRIGSESMHGAAYLNTGKGFRKLLKFSCKLMDQRRGHALEVTILKEMTTLVEKHVCPNFPITYRVMRCNELCAHDCPRAIRDEQYYVVMSELADADLSTHLRRKYDGATYESLLMQMIFAVYFFHQMGYNHNDCHLGNFLVHKITPGGYWKYRIDTVDVFVPNTGHLLVIWDPGMATWGSDRDYGEDYRMCFGDMASLNGVPRNIRSNIVTPVMDVLNNGPRFHRESDFVEAVLNRIFPQHVRRGDIPNRAVLNTRPYTLSRYQ